MRETWVVEMDCGELVLRQGTRSEVMAYDDLGCRPKTAPLASECEITALWEKNGEMRCEVSNG